MPKISIVIPTYNRAFVISRAMDSVLGQTFSDWECIVVDDRSTDNTKGVVDEYIKKDSRFEYCLNRRNRGAQGARNEGIIRAKGEWILLFDSDDYLYPDYLEKMAPLLTSNNHIVSCFGRMIEERTGKELQKMNNLMAGSVFTELLRGNCYYTYNSSIIRRKCLLEIGLLDEKCPSHQELDTHLRMSRLYEYRLVPEILWDYYVGREDTISTDSLKHIEGLLYVKRKHLFYYRTKAYRSFLVGMRHLWELTEEQYGKRETLRRKILLLAPELPFFLMKRKMKKLC